MEDTAEGQSFTSSGKYFSSIDLFAQCSMTFGPEYNGRLGYGPNLDKHSALGSTH